MKRRFEIKNRRGQKIVGVVEVVENAKGVVIVMHGSGGFQEQPHLELISDLYQAEGYAVVRFDGTSSLGESEGEMIDFRVTTYLHDLEDLVDWVKKQEWFMGGLHFAGHSIGGLCANIYAQNHPRAVASVVSLSSTLSGAIYRKQTSHNLDAWKACGYRESTSKSKPGHIKRYAWELIEDLDKYDVLEGASKMTMPVLVVVGDEDRGVSPEDQERFCERIAGPSVFYKFKKTDHNYQNEGSLEQLFKVLHDWVSCLPKGIDK